MPVAWKLKEFLDTHDLKPARLVQASGIPQATVYRLVRGDTRNLNADTLGLTLDALRALTGEPVGLTDVLEYRVPTPPPAEDERAWLDADVSRLGEIDPYEWGEGEADEGETLRFVPGQGLVVVGD